MEDRKTGAKGGFIAAKQFVSETDARLESLPFHSDAAGAAGKELAGGRNEIGSAAGRFGDGSGQGPGEAKIDGEVLVETPIVLHVRPVDFPAAAGDVASEVLVVDADAGKTEQQVGGGVGGPRAADHFEAVLKAHGADIHLVSAEIEADTNVVLPFDHVQGITDGEDIGAALKWGVAAVTEGPETRRERDGCETATAAGAFVVGIAIDVCSRN